MKLNQRKPCKANEAVSARGKGRWTHLSATRFPLAAELAAKFAEEDLPRLLVRDAEDSVDGYEPRSPRGGWEAAAARADHKPWMDVVDGLQFVLAILLEFAVDGGLHEDLPAEGHPPHGQYSGGDTLGTMVLEMAQYHPHHYPAEQA